MTNKTDIVSVEDLGGALKEDAITIVDFIATPENHTKLADFFKKVSETYRSWWREALHLRVRGSEITQTENIMRSSENSYENLQIIHDFLSHGEWKSTSSNTILLLELIKTIPGCGNLEKTKKGVRLLLPEQIRMQIKLRLDAHEEELAAIAAEEQAIEDALMERVDALPETFLFSDAVEAENFFKHYPESLVFYVKQDDVTVSLFWLDEFSKSHYLPIDAESNLATFLREWSEQDISLEELDNYEDIKIACQKIYLNSAETDLVIVSSEEEAKNLAKLYPDQWFFWKKKIPTPDPEHFDGLKALFDNKPLTIQWLFGCYNALGIQSTFSILDQGTNMWDDQPELHFLLKQELREEVNNFLMKDGLLVNPPMRNGQLINQKGMLESIRSTFVIHNTDGVTLDWYDANGGKNEIPLAHYPDLLEWLSDHTELDEADEMVLRNQLRHINARVVLKESKKSILPELEKLWAEPTPKPAPVGDVKKIDANQYDKVNQFYQACAFVLCDDMQAVKKFPDTYYLTKKDGQWLLYFHTTQTELVNTSTWIHRGALRNLVKPYTTEAPSTLQKNEEFRLKLSSLLAEARSTKPTPPSMGKRIDPKNFEMIDRICQTRVQPETKPLDRKKFLPVLTLFAEQHVAKQKQLFFKSREVGDKVTPGVERKELPGYPV